MKSIEIKAGERVRVIRKFSNSMQVTYKFSAEPVAEGEEVSGVVEICGSNWLFPKPPTTQKLTAVNSVDKGMWDTFYSVYVIPDRAVRVSSAGGDYGKIWPLLLLGLAVAGIASAVFFAVF